MEEGSAVVTDFDVEGDFFSDRLGTIVRGDDQVGDGAGDGAVKGACRIIKRCPTVQFIFYIQRDNIPFPTVR